MLIKITLPLSTSHPSTIAITEGDKFIYGKSRKDNDRRNLRTTDDDLFVDDLENAFNAIVARGYSDTRRIEVQIGRWGGTLSYHTSPEALVKDSVLLGYDETEAREQAAAFNGKSYCLGVFERTDFRSIKLVPPETQLEPLAALLGFTIDTLRGMLYNDLV